MLVGAVRAAFGFLSSQTPKGIGPVETAPVSRRSIKIDEILELFSTSAGVPAAVNVPATVLSGESAATRIGIVVRVEAPIVETPSPV